MVHQIRHGHSFQLDKSKQSFGDLYLYLTLVRTLERNGQGVCACVYK